MAAWVDVTVNLTSTLFSADTRISSVFKVMLGFLVAKKLHNPGHHGQLWLCGNQVVVLHSISLISSDKVSFKKMAKGGQIDILGYLGLVVSVAAMAFTRTALGNVIQGCLPGNLFVSAGMRQDLSLQSYHAFP